MRLRPVRLPPRPDQGLLYDIYNGRPAWAAIVRFEVSPQIILIRSNQNHYPKP